MEWTLDITTIFAIFILTLIFCGVFHALSVSFLSNSVPGPTGLPGVGNGISLLLSKHPERLLTTWKKKYGDIYACSVGRKRMVVLSNCDTIRKVFCDEVTVGRDQNRVVSGCPMSVGPDGQPGLIASEGDTWFAHRRFIISTMREALAPSYGMEDFISAEVDAVMDSLRNSAEKAFDPEVAVKRGVGFIICKLIFGDQFNRDNSAFTELVDLFSVHAKSGNSLEYLATSFPFLHRLPGPLRYVTRNARHRCADLTARLQALVDEHRFNEGAWCLLNGYEEERKRGIIRHLFGPNQLIGTLSDIFDAGTGPVTSTVLWSLMLLVQHPDVLLKMQAEMDISVKDRNKICLADIEKLQYNCAAILEVTRLASVVPLAMAHRTLHDMSIGPYKVPKNTLIVPNLYSVHHDERWWKNPNEFDPNRFLEDGKVARPDCLLTFSTGKRSCMGEGFAKLELVLFVTNIVRCFDLQVPPGHTMTMDYASNVVNCPASFKLIFKPRNVPGVSRPEAETF